jgi:Flp pilus assembly protein TadD
MRRATLLAGRAAFAREDYPKAAALISSALSTAGRGEDAAYPMSATQPPDLIRLDRAVPEDVLKLAMARGAAGDLAGAVADAETYLRLRPENPAAKRMLEAMRKSLGGG